jgi:hypothetical protein
MVVMLTVSPVIIAAITIAVVPVQSSAVMPMGSVAAAPPGNISTSFVESSFTPPFQPTVVFVQVSTTTTTKTTISLSSTTATESISVITTETSTQAVTYSGATATSGPPGAAGRYYTVPCGDHGIALVHVYDEVDENGHVTEVHEVVGTVGCDARQTGGSLTNPVIVGVIGAVVGAALGAGAMYAVNLNSSKSNTR